MKLAVRYLAQLRHAVGSGGEEVELPGPLSVRELLAALAARRPALLTPALLVFVGDEQAEPERQLRDGDEVTLLTPVAGGGA